VAGDLAGNLDVARDLELPAVRCKRCQAFVPLARAVAGAPLVCTCGHQVIAAREVETPPFGVSLPPRLA
jgi:hypothetical protein